MTGSWLMGISLLLAFTGLAVGVQVFQRVRGRRRAHRMPEAETVKPVESPKNNAKASLKALRAQWNMAIQFLRRSRLKKSGNPLYVLPWYMVIGAPGSGKTTALRGARLPSFAESSASTAALAATGNVEWSFFEQAIVIDTAGRYAVPQTPAVDDEEWRSLLDLLIRGRSREPLNGLVVTVSADQLLTASADALETLGKSFRKRINDLIALAGYQLPIYVLVTKCDLLPGMTRFYSGLSSQGLSQTMGCLNDTGASDTAGVLENTFSVLGSRLKSLRLILAGQSTEATIDPALFLFPETFAGLRAGLASFLRGSFSENHYHEAPPLRGIYFSSGIPADPSVPNAAGYFLQEFFSKLLPEDRPLFKPTRRALRWRQGTMGLAVTAWMTLSLALAGLMSYAFIRNMKTVAVLLDASADYAQLTRTKQDFTSQVLTMERFSQLLLDLDAKQTTPLLDFGLRDVSGAQNTFKHLLSAQFRQEILSPLDEQTRSTLATFTASSPDERFSRYVAHLVDRLGVLREEARGTNLRSMQQTIPTFPYLRVAGQEADNDVKEKVGALYVRTAFWTDNRVALQQERTVLQEQLKRLLTLKGSNPQWLIAWAAMQQSIPSVTLSEAWGGRAQGAREPSIPGLFSVKGKALIDAFFLEVESALNDPAISSDLRFRFERWYRENAFGRWHQFVMAFPRGAETLENAEQRRTVAGRMAAQDSPYVNVSQHVLQEFSRVPEADLPPWISHIRQIQSLLKTPAFWKYQQALDKLAKAVSDPSQVVATTAQAFDSSAAPGASLFAVAFESLAKLKASAPRELTSDAAVWKLVSGPLDYLWENARGTTAEKLQSDWETQVLAQATGLNAAQGLPVLLSKDGPAMRFVKEQAGPFVEWRPDSGFGAKSAFQSTLPFNSAFFSFLNGATWMSSVSTLQVGITASTPEVNVGAKRIPNIIQLTLHCGDAKQTLRNRRLRVLESTFDTVEKTFTWTPACSETTIEIDLAGNHLSKSYPGTYGFFAFLHDFQSGKHAYTVADFPFQARALEELSVTSVALKYRLKGAPDYAAPKSAPANIVRK